MDGPSVDGWPKRHLMRMWLSLPDGRLLPPEMAEKWINIEVGTRRGGVPTDKEPVIPLDRSRPPTLSLLAGGPR